MHNPDYFESELQFCKEDQDAKEEYAYDCEISARELELEQEF